MKKMFQCAAALLLLSTLVTQLSTARAQGTAFTYQGRLNDGANPATGKYDLTFALFNAASGGGQAGGTLTNAATGVTNGLFIVALDFGGVFDGTGYWLEIGVRTNGNGAFTTLSQRQKVTPTPYAIYAENVNASGISGTVPGGSLGGVYGSPVTLNNAANNFTGNGSGLTSVNAATVGGQAAGNFWNKSGNSGTTAGVNFIGTTDNQALELKVNGQRTLRLEPPGNNGYSVAPNIIAGSSVNFANNGVIGATIAGGGGTNGLFVDEINNVSGDFGTVGGGRGNKSGQSATVAGGVANQANGLGATAGGGNINTVNGLGATVSGGFVNQASGSYSVIGGGAYNVASGIGSFIGGGGDPQGLNGNNTSGTNSVIGGGFGNYNTGGNSSIGGGDHNAIFDLASTIGGGAYNHILSGGDNSFIGGGAFNSLAASDSTISGGVGNTIQSFGTLATIGGGYGNNASRSYCVIGGGWANTNNGNYSVIGGGFYNRIDSGFFAGVETIAGGSYNYVSGNYSFVGGGLRNTASGVGAVIGGGGDDGLGTVAGNLASGGASVIGGGIGNVNGGNASTIGGGYNNQVKTGADHATIGGGNSNFILDNSYSSTIAGGENNLIDTNNIYSTVAGGKENQIHVNATGSTIGGGEQNQIQATSAVATIGGGQANTNTGTYATIPGGFLNVATNYAFAAGNRAKAVNTGAFVWADSQGADFSSTANNQFAVRANGGMKLNLGSGNLEIASGGLKVTGAGVGTATPVFIHRAIAANISGNVTTITNSFCDGNPNAILIVTPNYNPGGSGGTYNNHPIGVYYNGSNWTIFNQDVVAMPVNAAFNVLVVQP